MSGYNFTNIILGKHCHYQEKFKCILLSKLRFSDDIVLIAVDLDQAQITWHQLSEESRNLVSRWTYRKRKWWQILTMVTLKNGVTVIERVVSFVYLAHKLKLGFAWAEFGKLRIIFKSKYCWYSLIFVLPPTRRLRGRAPERWKKG